MLLAAFEGSLSAALAAVLQLNNESCEDPYRDVHRYVAVLKAGAAKR